MIRFALQQNRSITDRFVGYLEQALSRQEEVNAGFRSAIENLTSNVRENSSLLQRISERMGL